MKNHHNPSLPLFLKYKAVFEEYGIQAIEEIAQKWAEPHRFFHNEAHLASIVKTIEAQFEKGEINEEQRNILLMSAYFHDVVYDPKRNDNEEQSAVFFIKRAGSHPNINQVREIILDTKTHEPNNPLSKRFTDIDMQIVTQSDFTDLLEWELSIFKEYQYIDYTVYKIHRLILLRKMADSYPENRTNLQHLVDYLEKHKPKIGIYPGSFNPFHFGHLNILEKAERIFDKVIIARGINPNKEDINAAPLEVNVLKYRQFENFSGFLTDYINTKEQYAEVTLIRGLRNGADLDYEVNQLRFMEDMKPDLKVIFITCDKEFEHISSSSIKNMERIDKDFSKRYVPL